MTEFRNATRAELGQILDWAANEGWNPGIDDADAFYAADPNGFFVATDKGDPVAAISVVNHTDSFAFLGLYIAKPSHRGQGISHALWQHAIAHAGDRTIGLDGVPEQQANYVASGFQLDGGTTRFAGPIPPKGDVAVRMATTDDIPALIAQEAAASGVKKPAYLSAWFAETEHRKTLIADQGFCTVRKCRDGAKVGPLLAEDAATARALIHKAATLLGEHLTIDVPVSAVALSQECRALQMEPGFATARMYKGTAPTGGAAHFAVTSLELG